MPGLIDAPAILDVRNLSVDAVVEGRPTVPILRDVSFALAPRRILGVIGESGSGKTVLSRALADWLPSSLQISQGDVVFDGMNLADRAALRGRRLRGNEIAYVGANPAGALDPTLPVGHQLMEKLRAVRPELSAAAARVKVLELLGAVNIPSAIRRFDEYPSQFSGGMMQRAMLVDALVSDPKLLIADNITQPLDVTVAAQILRLMRSLCDRFGTAIVFFCSSLPMVHSVADEIAVLAEGRIVESQSPADLVASPRHAYTRKLLEQTPRIWTADAASVPEPTSRVPILSVRGVSRHYKVRRRGSFNRFDTVQAVRDVSFDVNAGENFGIVGESGCGKSTLTRLLAGLEASDGGEILFQGELLSTSNAKSLKALRRDFQLLLQDPYNALPPRMSVGRMIAEPLSIHGLARGAAVRDRVEAAMHEVGLDTALYDRLPVGLSAGQRQRISIARALVLEPKLIILDETLSSLDQPEQMRLLALFEQLQKQHGLTYIFISHDIAMVRRICTRIAVMYLGEIVELAANRTLFFDPGHPYSRALLSAAPVLEPPRYLAADCLLEGEPPSPIDIPVGCSFASRCPQVFAPCRAASPALRNRADGDRAACFLVEERV